MACNGPPIPATSSDKVHMLPPYMTKSWIASFTLAQVQKCLDTACWPPIPGTMPTSASEASNHTVPSFTAFQLYLHLKTLSLIHRYSAARIGMSMDLGIQGGFS
ncbi:hypothetical protein NEUTE2DRAFT_75548 [Neurospora tetrasperma FGSC 2509]|nr:hypothetical protein NEUTE2DRAFT_75548 [Neurospora tetrasperma FGSC 2509]